MATPVTPAPKKKKAAKSKGAAPAVVTPPAVPPGNAPPTPAGFVKLFGEQIRAMRKTPDPAKGSAAAVGAEITASKTFVTDFGSKGPTAATIAAALETAGAWTTELANATNWMNYAHDSAATAWDAANALLDKFSPYFEAALKEDPTIETRDPLLFSMMRARSSPAQRGAATRAANKAKADAAAAAATPAVVPPATK